MEKQEDLLLKKSTEKSMPLLNNETFICLDCETTGLDYKNDHIIEIAAVKFTLAKNFETFETLIDPCQAINPKSIEIHHITDDMVKGKPKIQEVLGNFLELIKGHIIVGHGIKFDLDFLKEAAKQNQIPNTLDSAVSIDTLRLARLYGESSSNSLEKLREHFNIDEEGAHRAMGDVIVNISVFKKLCASFKTTEQLLERLKKPIQMRLMPLGKYKGRPFSDLPTDYLYWAVNGDFDQDLIFSLQSEIKKRKRGSQFGRASNPFLGLSSKD